MALNENNFFAIKLTQKFLFYNFFYIKKSLLILSRRVAKIVKISRTL